MTATADLADRLKERVESVFVGKDSQVDLLLTAFLAGLHVLIEDIPGVGKTTLALALAKSTGLDFGRIQFTPDLLPGDIIGMTVWSGEKREFMYKPGGIMHSFLLADEINRASERTQSALLEAMAEGTVSVDGRTYALPEPFFVMATQNPVGFSGTYLLPESQADRFGISLSLGYPAGKEEKTILRRFRETSPLDKLEPAAEPEELTVCRREIRAVHVEPRVEDYLLDLVRETRSHPELRLGISPRGTLQLLLASQAAAARAGRDYVMPEDVMAMIPPGAAHRIHLTGEARLQERKPENLLRQILSDRPVPAGFS